MNTTDLQQQYERDGFVVLREVLSRDECAVLKAEGLRVLKEHARPNSSVFVGVAAASQVFYDLASDPRIAAALEPLMPEGIMFMSDKFVWKSGDARFGTPWHCDSAYWKNTRPKISVWIPLDDATAQNGTLKVLPGAHKQDWQHGAGDMTVTNNEFANTISSIPDDAPNEMICEIPAGSLLIFSDRLPHASCPNTAGLDRYAIISTYHAPQPEEEFDLSFPARHMVNVVK